MFKYSKLIVSCIFFVCILGIISLMLLQADQNNSKQEVSFLENAIRESAIHYYAMEGEYPESLDVILDTYHITYDPERYVIDYEPQISNLLPYISVISIRNKR